MSHPTVGSSNPPASVLTLRPRVSLTLHASPLHQYLSARKVAVQARLHALLSGRREYEARRSAYFSGGLAAPPAAAAAASRVEAIALYPTSTAANGKSVPLLTRPRRVAGADGIGRMEREALARTLAVLRSGPQQSIRQRQGKSRPGAESSALSGFAGRGRFAQGTVVAAPAVAEAEVDDDDDELLLVAVEEVVAPGDDGDVGIAGADDDMDGDGDGDGDDENVSEGVGAHGAGAAAVGRPPSAALVFAIMEELAMEADV